MTPSGYRLALDLGTNSIGWCILNLNGEMSPGGLRAAGVRIFADGRNAKDQSSLAVDRRLARQMRRRRDRYLNRRAALLNLLTSLGLMPVDAAAAKQLERHDPYALRARGLRERLTPHELGRAIFHINQRRGFRSNRKTDKDGEAGKIKPAIKRLRELMAEAGAGSLGDFLNRRRLSGLPVRVRPKGQGAKAEYEYYPERSLLEEEFDAIWKAQSTFDPSLTEAAREQLRGIIFHQRPLKPVNPGRCTLEPDQPRAPVALPIAQRFRIMQELNHLRVVSGDLAERPLNLGERQKLAAVLLQGKDLTFDAMRQRLSLPPGYSFNLEGENRDRLRGDQAAHLLSKKTLFGASWLTLSPAEQERLVDLLLEEEDEGELVAALVADWGLDAQRAAAVGGVNLPAGYARLSRKALHAVTDCLAADVIHYADAVTRAGYASHSHFATGEILDRLPYYGVVLQRHVGFGTGHPADRAEERYGRIANPTVHIALNQVRRVVNELVKLHGHPAQVVVEVARDLKNGIMARREIAKRQAEMKRHNDRRRADLQALGIAVTADALLRLRLWEELAADPAARCCPYTGETISMGRLFSPEVEVDHILPFSRTLDNSPSNMTVSLRRANRYKGNRTPEEAFALSPVGYHWDSIVARAGLMVRGKRWRFAEGAMARYEEEGDFLDRQLVDTQYIARVAREYLSCICDPKKVWVTPGRLTSLLAARWGFPRKDRNDHRHHARDAVLVGVMDRGLLQRVATHHARLAGEGVERFLAGLPEPWPGYRTEVLTRIHTVVVSHKADHGVAGALHNQTAYGIRGENGTPGNAQYRVPLEKLAAPTDLLRVKGLGLRTAMLAAASGMPLRLCREKMLELATLPEKEAKARLAGFADIPAKEFATRLAEFAAGRNMRRVRVLDTLTLIHVGNGDGAPYKGFKGDSNAYYDIFLRPDGEWAGEIVSTMDANRPGFMPQLARQGLPRVMRLFNGDMLEIEDAGVRRVVYVVKQSEKQIVLAEHFEANADNRNRDKEDPFRFIYKSSPAALRKAGAVPLFVTPTGCIRRLEVPRHAAAYGGNSR